jgi:dTDP-4-dehydrorhamnose reductase
MKAALPTIVLLGASGMLGRAMAAALDARGWPVLAPTRHRLDLADAASIAAFPWPPGHAAPWHIINCAAWTDVDGAEEREAEATTVNAQALRALANARGPRTILVSFSTDYVFDGSARTPYAPDHPRRPLNAYGRGKAAGEAVLEALPDSRWLNIRTSWLHAPWGTSFVRTMARLLHERPEVRVVDDQRGRPTSVTHLADATLRLLAMGHAGHWHVCDGGDCTWFDLALAIARLTDAPAAVLPCGTAEFPRPAQRPAFSVLDLSRTEASLGPMPHWSEGLARTIAALRQG